MSSTDITHAGGVVAKIINNKTHYLIITSKKNPNNWVLPKGHIEKNESPEKAALREVLEETGIKATIKDKLSSVQFELNEEHIHVQFYLMEYLNEEVGWEDRTMKWCSLEEGLALLSFEDTRKILIKADKKLRGF